MKRILVAGIGNAWLSDDGFGGEVVKRLEARELREGAAVFDFGTGGLDLAYEAASVEAMGIGLSEEVAAAVDGAVKLVVQTIEELQADAAYAVD